MKQLKAILDFCEAFSEGFTDVFKEIFSTNPYEYGKLLACLIIGAVIAFSILGGFIALISFIHGG
jgi:hypothetical protein